MPGFDTLLTFFVSTLLFAYMPGPALLYTAAQTLARGRAAGLMAALGIHLGGYAHVAAASAGLSALFLAVPSLYLALKLAEAAYLIWLGWRMLKSRADGALPEIPRKSARRAFVESVTVELLNPKTALFFLAFLPQFVDPAAALPVWLQFLILGTLINLTFSSADVVCVLLAGAVTRRLGHGGGLARRAGGGLLIGLGAHLALQQK